MAEQLDDARRNLAIKRIEEKNGFRMHAVVYAVVNATVVLIWLFTGAQFFWPIFPIAIWGMGLILHGYTVYRPAVYTEQQVREEMDRLPRDTINHPV